MAVLFVAVMHAQEKCIRKCGCICTETACKWEAASSKVVTVLWLKQGCSCDLGFKTTLYVYITQELHTWGVSEASMDLYALPCFTDWV